MKKFIVIIILSSLLQSCVTTTNEDQSLAAEDNVKLGLAYLQQGYTPLAKEKLLLALEEAPHWSVTQDAMAYFFEATGDKKTAEKYYQHAIIVSPEEGAALNNYGDFLCRDRRPLAAEKMFLQAGELPNYLNTAQAYENAGLCALTIPDNSKAKMYFRKALAREPLRIISARELKKLDG